LRLPCPQLSAALAMPTSPLYILSKSRILRAAASLDSLKSSVLDSGGKKIAEYDSVLSIDFGSPSDIADYPVERGSFASYNKVDKPSMLRVSLGLGGTEAKRNAFQSALRDAKKSLNLYTIVTEDQSYRNFNLVDIGWTRSASQGAHYIAANCEFQEVRQQEAQAFNQPAQPQGADQINVGQVQPIPDVNIDTSGVV